MALSTCDVLLNSVLLSVEGAAFRKYSSKCAAKSRPFFMPFKVFNVFLFTGAVAVPAVMSSKSAAWASASTGGSRLAAKLVLRSVLSGDFSASRTALEPKRVTAVQRYAGLPVRTGLPLPSCPLQATGTKSVLHQHLTPQVRQREVLLAAAPAQLTIRNRILQSVASPPRKDKVRLGSDKVRILSLAD